ncbi:hypothetical protein RQP46_005153 [Phenoliferia psychrophenolica]
MPLLPPTSQTPSTVLSSIPSSVSPTDPFFLIFFSSINEAGVPWCPDCRDVQPAIAKTISEERNPNNPFRLAFGIKGVPTIIKLTSPATGFQSVKASDMVQEDVILDEQKLKKWVGV